MQITNCPLSKNVYGGSHLDETMKQRAMKVVETLLGNDAFRHLRICAILFASGVNSLIPPAPQFNVVQALWSVQS